jgi:TPR repeat protein
MSFKPEQYEWKNRELNSIAELLKKIDLTTSSPQELTKKLMEALESILNQSNATELLSDLAITSLNLSWGGDYLNHAKCFEYLYKSAENGYAPAQYEIACQAEYKRLFPPHNDYEDEQWISEWFSGENEQHRNFFLKSEYDHWLRLAAENKFSQAQYQLSTDLFNSDDPASNSEALEWLEKAAYNHIPLPSAQFEYAKRIENGEYQYDRNSNILNLYEKAALGGDADAMLRMGKFYEEGNEGVAQDNEEAVRWYELSIENYAKEYYLDEEIHLGEAHLRVGKLMLALDKEGGNCSDKAISHLEEAGNAGVVDAMYIVGTELVKYAVKKGGSYFKESYDDNLMSTFSEGINWLRNAAENNSIDAIDKLAYLYDSGEINFGRNTEWGEDDEPEDLEVALKLYEKAHAIEPNDYYPKAISRIQYKLKALSDESEVQEQSQNS